MVHMKTMKRYFIISFFIFISLFAFTQQDIRYDADKNLPFNEKADDVNPQTGNVTISVTDIDLPGRAGMDFTFTRIWNLNQSNVYHMYQDPYDGSNRLSCDTLERVNRMGAGWSTTIPYIMDDTKSGQLIKNLFIDGNVFNIDYDAATFKNGPLGNETYSNLIGYDLLDYRIYRDAGVSYNQFPGGIPSGYNLWDTVGITNMYVLILKDNSRYYFRGDGKIMMQQDRSGLNRIWYFYEDDAEGLARLKLVIDTTGREIRFDYSSEGNLSTISWDVMVGTKTGEDRNRELVTRQVSYFYANASIFPEVARIYYLVNTGDEKPSYVLTRVVDPEKNTTRYAYKEGVAAFSFDVIRSHYENVYLMLTEETTYYNDVTGEYKNKRIFEYEVPAKGMYSKLFYNGFMKYYKVSRQYYLNKNGKKLYDTQYIYYDEGEMGNYNQYSAVIETKNKKVTYYYSMSDNIQLQHVLKAVRTETDDGFIEQKEIIYDQHRTKVQEDVYRNGKWVYRETFEYDRKGNLKRHTDRIGLFTYMEYDDVYSIPLKEIRTVTVAGTKKDYERRNVINDLGQVIQQKIYLEQSGGTIREVIAATNEYDEFGNIIARTDAHGNTIYRVYDETSHTFPVKMYQHVTIDSWQNGLDVHTNWRTSPDVEPAYVRIRNWNVFNTDGTVWMEIDNGGYAVEHYYDKNGIETETVNPNSDDDVFCCTSCS
jgi:hypothetical protein